MWHGSSNLHIDGQHNGPVSLIDRLTEILASFPSHLRHSSGFTCVSLPHRSDVTAPQSHYSRCSDEPRATVSSDRSIIPAGDRVRLSCSVVTSEGWSFDWFRRESESSPSIKYNKPDRVTEGGLYSCRGGRGDPVYYTQTSSEVTIYKTVSIKPSVILEPSWSLIFRGETVTLRCQIHGGGTPWMYGWRTPNRNSPTSSEYKINRVTESDSGEYRCYGRSGYHQTDWSDAFRLSVLQKPQPVLSVSPSWLSPGASVTLSCQIHHPSAGWRFFWYQVVPKPLSSSYNYELLSGHSNGTEQNSYIIHGQKHTAGYVCRAGRQPEYLTDYSQPKFVWSEDVDPAASLSVNPDRVQHFSSLSVSLSCEGNSTEWRVKRFTDTGLSDCSMWRTRTGSSCTIKPYCDSIVLLSLILELYPPEELGRLMSLYTNHSSGTLELASPGNTIYNASLKMVVIKSLKAL
ncbi:platelet endothelial cell adhesion molecule-like [Nematolebias whitei]|uniref:platelet endothelial cell adhesion molecule-like n=1 Tax=Nematolebias whitei TaxID=451745 RepID=UPI001896D412|nr:platelet endothelial cell adhesion molecule-like [Nematolebias whitei]